MMNISDFNKCANCGACYNVCPKNAIKIEADHPFYTLSVDTELCVDCGLCKAVCPVNNEITPNAPLYAVGCWHKEETVVASSSSGGVFYALAEEVTTPGGVVYGAGYSKDCKSVRFFSTDDTSLESLQKSKYVESLVGESFKEVKNWLEKGRRVLFCGAPCQIAGLKSYLKKDYDLLITCDFACGGMPSHRIYEDYISALEKKYRSEAINVDFRPKTHGWQRYAVLVNFANGKKHNRLGVEDEYLRSFLYGKYTVRDYCLECKFSDNHMSDISLADFWLHKKLSKLENSNGISLVLCNTDKGKEALKGVMDRFVFAELDLSEAAYNNKPTLMTEAQENKQKQFRSICAQKGLKAACDKVLPRSFKEKLKHRIVRVRCRKDKK